MHPTASLFIKVGIGGLALLVASGVIAAVYFATRAEPSRKSLLTTFIGVDLWLLFTGALGASGRLTSFAARPPPFALLVLTGIALTFLLALSPVGAALARLPLWVLIATQAFRLPLELVMHEAAVERTMPVEMSYNGFNFDIVTGALAIAVALLVRRGGPRWAAWAWNFLGTLTLIVVVTIAIFATPAFHVFGREPGHLNTWVSYFPFVWLPTVLVSAALLGHVVLFRRLVAERRGSLC